MHGKTLVTGLALAGGLAFLHIDLAHAQSPSGVVRLENTRALAAATRQYWTPERLANARPKRAATNFAAEAFVAPESGGAPQVSPGRGPAAGVAPNLQNRLYDPSIAGSSAAQLEEDGIAPQNAGTLAAHFTSSRLVPTSADTAYPYRTAGKLFFSDGVSNFVCSASVISYRVLVTAGHCVHSGTSAGFYRNFLFVPAFRNGSAPFGTWNWAFVTVTSTWANGGGGVPNAADYAMFEMADRATAPTRIGQVTGFLGWQTQSLARNHVTMLGYPCNLDSCNQMHQVTAGSFRATSPNNVEYGSDARGGSSGGPWVQNFGVASAGQTGGTNAVMNRVVAVTSYGYISTDPKVQGASIPDSRWVQLWNTVCAHRAGNCTP